MADGATPDEREAERRRTREWLDALEDVVRAEGPHASARLLAQLENRARALGVPAVGPRVPTPFVDTLPPIDDRDYPGDLDRDATIEALVRWNAMAMVARANRDRPGIGGHLGSYASAATLFEVGFMHAFEATDRLYLQGHASPGVYARAYLEGRLDEGDLDGFRAETRGGLSSYPHPWLMPSFWTTPTVSMGLGPLLAIYQARFDRYLHDRGLRGAVPRTWGIFGDGEMDEPESTGALAVAARHGLSNLTFVIDANLQRLDGPVRGNGRVVSELAGIFAGAGWNVIQVVWSASMDRLLARDESGRVAATLARTVDGTWQRLASEGDDALHAHLAGDDEGLRALVDELGPYARGGHDRLRVWAAYRAAMDEPDRPTVILAHTVKGHGLGAASQASNVAHQAKELGDEALAGFRDHLEIDLDDDELEALPYLRAPRDVEAYLLERREALGGPVPRRDCPPPDVDAIPTAPFERFYEGSERELTTTAALVRLIGALAKDDSIGERVVPIVPDEARTFGLEALFPRLGIHESGGQRYRPVDDGSLLAYREKTEGAILEEGITEAGAMGSFVAAGTSHACGGPAMLPFFLFYSMFGFQRVGDLIWAAQDARARGFLIGATSGRTTLNGEGLQHQDGHSLLSAHASPHVRSYDVTYAYEVAAIVEDGARRMLVEGVDELVYLTVQNEPFPMPSMPEGAREGILRGAYLLDEVDDAAVSLMGSGMMLHEALRARELLAREHGVEADVYAVTSWGELHRDASSAARLERLGREAPATWLREVVGDAARPFVAVTDWMRALPDLIARWLPGPLTALGTDGFGRSDERAALRRHFEVDAEHVVVAALRALGRDADAAIVAYGIDARAEDPRLR